MSYATNPQGWTPTRSPRYPAMYVPQYEGRLSGLGAGIFSSLLGLGQAKYGAATEDHTAQDWGTALTTGGSLISSIVGAATGQPATTPGTTLPPVDPMTATAPPVSASPDWYWPVVIGVGVAVLGGIGYMSYNVKAPVKSNRRRRVRRNRRHRRS